MSVRQSWWYPSPHQFDGVKYDGEATSTENAWDVCTLGSNRLPGLAKLRIRKGRKLDKKRPPGAHFATVTDQGYNPAELELTLIIWTPLQWDTFQDMMPVLEPPATKGYAAPTFDIVHPAAAVRSVKAIVIEDIEGPFDSSVVKGAMEFRFKMIQFFPPPKNLNATNTPKNAIAPRANALSQPTAPTDPATVLPTP